MTVSEHWISWRALPICSNRAMVLCFPHRNHVDVCIYILSEKRCSMARFFAPKNTFRSWIECLFEKPRSATPK